MKFSRLALVIGFAAGYVLGARAGQQRYVQIVNRAERVWNSKFVTKQRENVADFVDEYVPGVVKNTASGLGQVASGVGTMLLGKGPREQRAKGSTQ